jgi:hypothetical protein
MQSEFPPVTRLRGEGHALVIPIPVTR